MKLKRYAARIVSAPIGRTKMLLASLGLLAAATPALAAPVDHHIAPLTQADGVTALQHPSALLLNYYLTFPQGATIAAPEGLTSDMLTRDLVMGLLMATFVAMVLGASFLWRESMSSLRKDEERRNRDAAGLF
ncbi:hypothetical protein FJU08_08405 [Martelella alba]|uniref:Uncharacterized protein n=1 Tax=Martelella alba TaxID=2590451 RepID=A0A506UBI7_9HYPH|nr:hypothetical protein [Martelella alba]TPW31753.1 hypothetical protein FJU08_08405 [Martelella alba]